jgi:HlyD family secretion protein
MHIDQMSRNCRSDVSPVPRFLTASVERGAISRAVTAKGNVEAVLTVDVSSQLSGRIADVFVNFNDTVSAGQPIARLDQEIFRARVTESAAALNVGLGRAAASGDGPRDSRFEQ